MTASLPAGLCNDLARHGYVHVPDVLSAVELEQLRSACERTIALARNGNWPFVRTLPKQFPSWGSDVSQGIWGVQHLMHPDLPDHAAFAASYFSPIIISAVRRILDCSADNLVMELYNLLVRPDRDFELRWHRDDIRPDVSVKEEESRLQEALSHTQWNSALYDDESLIVVPGSHLRARLDGERNAEPFDSNMADQKVVGIRAGDVVFYNNNILHRGVYKSNVQRMTLHGSMGVVGADPARARNVLQHGIGSWIQRCDFTNLPGTIDGTAQGGLAESMKQRLIGMGDGSNVGFSQSND